MKVIDLLITISKDENIPASIKINNTLFTFDEETKTFFCKDPFDLNCPLEDCILITKDGLNATVEVLGQ